jgi:antitoxin component of MazEF toxin-antitoxin module
MNAKIAKYGNSLTVRLPAAMASELDLREGDEISLRRIEGDIALERPVRSRLAARLATVAQRETEIGAGPALGRENE